MTTVIKAENVSKKYLISHQKKARYSTFSESLSGFGQRIVKQVRHPLSRVSEDEVEIFSALEDINFEIKQGEKVGLVGRNGAGKSTLLKLLSRITQPTTGQIGIKGRVASLLEVGTGFHPELTGRENIFLNGAILGMTKKDIQLKFDEIVAFSEVENFLDTPVKRYSSGMYVRLAFAIAAHLESEILIVDEVLAVGDSSFQKKCLGKMDDIGDAGRTLLFVSHNMAMISSLCQKGILIDSGRVAACAPMMDVVNLYYNKSRSGAEVDYSTALKQPGDRCALLLKGEVRSGSGKVVSEVKINEPVFISMEYQVLQDGLKLNPNYHIYNSDGICVFVTSDSALDKASELKISKGRYKSTCCIPENLLNDGTYYIGLALTGMPGITIHFFEENALALTVVDPINGVITRSSYSGPIAGLVRPNLKWESEKLT